MRDSHYRITLDITKTQSQVSLSAKQGETSRKIYINLVEGSHPYEIDGSKCSAVFHGVKSDGTKLQEYCIIEGDKIRYDFTEQTTAAVGLVECDITLHSIETGVIASPHFNIIVDNRAIEPDVLSEDQAITFDEVLTEFGDIRNAEAGRVAAEAERVSAEETRQNKDVARDGTEALRVLAENSRKSAEIQRAENENNRKVSEDLREDAENRRVSEELLRIDAEEERQAMWNNSVENPEVWKLEKGCYYVKGKVWLTEEKYVTAPLSILYVGAYSNHKSFVLFTTLTNGAFSGITMGTTNGTTADIRYVETTGNKVTILDENSTDDQYPTAKAVFDALLAQAISIEVEPFEEEAQAVALALEDVPTVMSLSNTNTADTKVTLTVTDGQTLDIRDIYRYNANHCGVTHIDWDDGSSTDIVGATDDEMKHTYTTGGTYTITLVGMTIFRGFANKNVSVIVLGSTITEIFSVANNLNLSEITVYAETPPTINGASTTSFVFGTQVTKITVPNDEYSSVLGWSIYADKITVDSSLNGGSASGGDGDSGESGGDTPGGNEGGNEGGDIPGGDTGGGDDNGDSGNENPGGSTDIVSGSGYKLHITTAEGTETLYVYQGKPGNDGKNGVNGKDGKDGKDGADGVSPTIAVEEIRGGNRLIITDKNGEQTVDIIGGSQSENTADTKVTLTVTDGYTLALPNIYNYSNYSDVTYVDWGDGASNAVVGKTDDELKHKYAVGGTYTVTLVGLTHLAQSAFRAKPVVGVEIGSIVRSMGKMVFNECPNLTEVRIHAEVPPDLDLLSNGIGAFDLTVTKIIVPINSMYAYSKAVKWSKYITVLTADEFIGNVFADKVVTVGVGGDFSTINDALNYLSMFYPLYKSKGIKCEIQILDGTIINEQIKVERIDLSYITITSANANNTVQVDVTGWTGVTHDTRNNRPFFSGENGARLPAIKCLFSCIVPTGGWVSGVSTEADNTAVGYFCNRGSTGVICGEAIYEGSIAKGIENVGFENFYDNIIANNNSEIVLRESYARNAARYGVMARHISRVSARSANITNCGQVAKNGECAGAYADRSSMMDVRFADVSGSYNGLQCFNTSNMTAVETIAKNITNIVADSREGSVINCAEMTIDNVKNVFQVLNGGAIVATSTEPTNVTGKIHSKTINTLDANGVIYG